MGRVAVVSLGQSPTAADGISPCPTTSLPAEGCSGQGAGEEQSKEWVESSITTGTASTRQPINFQVMGY